MFWPRSGRSVGKDVGANMSGGIRWLPDGILERCARWRVERLLGRRVEEVGICVELIPANPLLKPTTWAPTKGTKEVLINFYLSRQGYLHIYSSLLRRT